MNRKWKTTAVRAKNSKKCEILLIFALNVQAPNKLIPRDACTVIPLFNPTRIQRNDRREDIKEQWVSCDLILESHACSLISFLPCISCDPKAFQKKEIQRNAFLDTRNMKSSRKCPCYVKEIISRSRFITSSYGSKIIILWQGHILWETNIWPLEMEYWFLWINLLD